MPRVSTTATLEVLEKTSKQSGVIGACPGCSGMPCQLDVCLSFDSAGAPPHQQQAHGCVCSQQLRLPGFVAGYLLLYLSAHNLVHLFQFTHAQRALHPRVWRCGTATPRGIVCMCRCSCQLCSLQCIVK